MAIDEPQLESMRAEILRLQERERSLLATQGELMSRLQALESENVRWKAVFEHASDGIYVKDLEGRYVLANHAAAALSGYPLDWSLGRTDDDLVPPETARKVRAADQEVMDTGKVQTYELQARYHSGEERTLLTTKYPYRDQMGAIAGVIAFTRDITERTRIQHALQESEGQFRALAQASFEAILLHEEFEILAVNKAFEQMFGYTGSEVTGMRTLDIVDAETRERIAAWTPGDPAPFVGTCVRKDGSTFPAEGMGRPCMYQGREVRVIAIRDLSEHRRLISELRDSEETLRAQNERLKELDRLKSGFVGAVSHELRTPLTSIKGYAEFLEDHIGGALSPEQLDYVQQILEGSVRLERLVDDLLDFARLEAGTFKLERHATDLGQKISEVLHSLHPQAQEKQLTLEADVLDLPTLNLGAGRIEQVLINLVGNAIKFTPAGGRVTVRARANAPSEIRVEVADTGQGIAAEHLPHLFDRFYQVDPSTTRKTGGTGLGLSIARALVSAHGGTMGVESEPARGSTFWFCLPFTVS